MCLLPVFYVGGVFSKSFCRPRDVGFHHRLYFLRLQKMMFKKHKYVTLANMPVMISLAKYISVYFDLAYVAFMPISWYIKVFILTCHMLHICLYHDIILTWYMLHIFLYHDIFSQVFILTWHMLHICLYHDISKY